MVYPSFFTDKKVMLYRDLLNGISYHLKDSVWKRINKSPNFLPVIHPKIKGFENTGNHWAILKHDAPPFVINETVAVKYVEQINDSLVFIVYKSPVGNSQKFYVIWFNMNNDTWYEPDLKISEIQKNRMRPYATAWDVQMTSENFWAEFSPRFTIIDTLKLNNFPHDWRAFRDKEGNFWVYTYNNGLYYIQK